MHLNGLQWEPPVSQTGLGVVKIIRDPGQNSVNKMGKITMSHMVMKTSRTKNAETGVTSSEAWQECVSKGWDYDSLHGSLEDWDSWIHSPLILFTLIKLGIESSGDSTVSENVYGIEKEYPTFEVKSILEQILDSCWSMTCCRGSGCTDFSAVSYLPRNSQTLPHLAGRVKEGLPAKCFHEVFCPRWIVEPPWK